MPVNTGALSRPAMGDFRTQLDRINAIAASGSPVEPQPAHAECAAQTGCGA